jgi:membrane-bound lytic murein transglycosylase D
MYLIAVEYIKKYIGQKKKKFWQLLLYNFFMQYIFCFASLNAYYVFVKNSILIFFKMLKNNFALSLVYGALFLCLLAVFLFTKFSSDDSKSEQANIIFSYPQETISFAGYEIAMNDRHYRNKQRFDKEFLISSNNLYQFYLYVKRAPLYQDYILKKLEEYGIPKDFLYLPFAESALRNDVVSSAWAAGIWQFMPETARRYDLRVDDLIDERYHFEKSTDAALRYIRDLYERFWDWSLVAAAYNRWENGLERDMQAQGKNNYYDLYLNDETSQYVFRIVAIKYVMQSYQDKKGVIDALIGGTFSLPEYSLYEIWETENLALWAQKNGFDYASIRDLNPWVLSDSLPQGNWQLKILTP